MTPTRKLTGMGKNEGVPKSTKDKMCKDLYLRIVTEYMYVQLYLGCIIFPKKSTEFLPFPSFNLQEASWLGSLLLLGACIGALVSSWVISQGRRRAVLASAFPRLVGWIMIGAASDVYMMYGGRYVKIHIRVKVLMIIF